jgi:hypothetical protein
VGTGNLTVCQAEQSLWLQMDSGCTRFLLQISLHGNFFPFFSLQGKYQGTIISTPWAAVGFSPLSSSGPALASASKFRTICSELHTHRPAHWCRCFFFNQTFNFEIIVSSHVSVRNNTEVQGSFPSVPLNGNSLHIKIQPG